MILIIANDDRMRLVAELLAADFPVFTSEDGACASRIKYVVLPFQTEGIDIGAIVKTYFSADVFFTPVPRVELAGVAPEKIKIMMADNDLALKNAIPTAEGVIYHVLRQTDVTIHGAKIVVIGAGRCGFVLCQKLQGLGANVVAVEKDKAVLGRLARLGIPTGDLDEQTLADADVVVNTVGGMMLNEKELQWLKQDVYVADIASAPFGTDLEVAGQLGLNAQSLPSLPSKIAPKTAAIYLADHLKKEIYEKEGKIADEKS